MIEEKIIRRTTALCETKLNAVNLFRGINEHALSTINYYMGLLPYEPKKFENLDKKVRGVLAKFQITRRASNMERLYLKRNRMGRGLVNLVDKAELMILNLYRKMNSQPNTKDLIVQEKHMASHLGLIEEFIKNKYGLVDDEVSLQNIRKIQEEKKIEAIKSKTMHSILFTDDDNVFDQKFSTLWLTKGNILGKQEEMMAKL